MRFLLIAFFLVFAQPVFSQSGDDTSIDISKIPTKRHGVKKGESFVSIAKNYGMNVSMLRKLNPGVKVLKPGMGLMVIPRGTVIKGVNGNGDTSLIGGIERYHKVESGESFLSIANKYNITVSVLRKLNPRVKTLKSGLNLKVIDRRVVPNDNKEGINELPIMEEEMAGGEQPMVEDVAPLDPFENPTVTPQFQGGQVAWHQFLQKNFVEPQRCKTAGIKGKTILKFTVKTDGTASGFVVLDENKKCPEYTYEAIRIIKTAGKWVPGKNEAGESIDSRHTVYFPKQ